jgi:hypothetical protein
MATHFGLLLTIPFQATLWGLPLVLLWVPCVMFFVSSISSFTTWDWLLYTDVMVLGFVVGSAASLHGSVA